MEHKFIRCGLLSCEAIIRLRGKGRMWCSRCEEYRAQCHYQTPGGQGTLKGITPIGSIGFVRA